MLVDKLHIFTYKITFFLPPPSYCETSLSLLPRSHFLTENGVIITKTSFFIQLEDSSIISNTNSMVFPVNTTLQANWPNFRVYTKNCLQIC